MCLAMNIWEVLFSGVGKYSKKSEIEQSRLLIYSNIQIHKYKKAIIVTSLIYRRKLTS